MKTVLKKGTIVLKMGTVRPVQGVAGALFGKTRLAVISILFARPEESFYLRRLAREAGAGLGAVQRETLRLSNAGIITRVAEDKQVYFQANRECPIFDEIRSLVVKTAGVGDVLSSALEKSGNAVQLAFIYGSVARGNDKSGSDVDLLVVGDASFNRIVSALASAQKSLGREINPSVFPPDEFRRKLRAGNHFLSTVMKDKKVFIKGDEHGLARLAG